VAFRFYSAEYNGIRKASVPIATADAAPLDQYWEDGPESWRRGLTFATSASTDNDYATSLVRAALDHRMLPHF
jgi:hypothetical protein